jgi:2-polyprenyl-3-methyl-5-hydroxy-6-metoxy-1,4-benzoquinol methylase
MPGQVSYYNQFGNLYKESILACPEPHLWTTDYNEQGRVYHEMKERIAQQQQLIEKYFDKAEPVLDIGCGFGRQAYWLALNGYKVSGTDTSDVFIDIANSLFEKNKLKGAFICTDILRDNKLTGSYRQILLFDVLEHIPPNKRRQFFERLHSLSGDAATLIISLPHVKKRLSSWVNNTMRRAITQHLPYFLNKEEHPYPIPNKNRIAALSKGLFNVHMFQSTPATDYYILHRI